MPENTPYENPLVRDGQSQERRVLKALLPDYVQVDERSREDFMAYAHEYAGLVQYYNDSNQRDGSWEDFFKENTDPDQPHYALFLAFTWLFRVLQEDINTITERHLDHYYKEILRLQTKPAKADSVHLLFEIAKNVEQHLLEAGTVLKAGKDDSGKELFYALDQDLVLNKTKVAELKTVFREPRFDEDGEVKKVDAYGMYAAAVADSSDGLGADQGTEGFQWKLFGESQEGLTDSSMQKASIGFMVASPALYLQEGTREINLGLTFKSSIFTDFIPYLVGNVLGSNSGITQDMVEMIMAAYDARKDYTNDQEDENSEEDEQEKAEKEAIQLLVDAIRANNDLQIALAGLDFDAVDYIKVLDEAIEASFGPALENAFVVSFSGEEGWIGPLTVNGTLTSSRHIKLEITLDRDQPAIANYLEEVLEAGIMTTQPVMQVMLNNDSVFRYDFLQPAEIELFVIDVAVTGVKNLVLQSDSATLNPDKPFQPFGPLPLHRSSLYVGSAEVFNKALTEFELNIDWADTPKNFNKHYAVYNTEIEAALTSAKATAQEEDFETLENEHLNFTNENFKGSLFMLDKGQWADLNANSSANNAYGQHVQLFTEGSTSSITLKARSSQSELNRFERSNQINTINILDNSTLKGFIKLQLSAERNGRFEAFGHKAFPTFYTEKIVEKTAPQNIEKLGTAEEIALPNEPYTPLIESLSLNYKTKVNINLSNLGDEPEQFFHVTPFGTEEKERTQESQVVTLLPSFANEGTLYIGLCDLMPPQNLSLLFQVNEKSVNHEFVGKVENQWSYLSDSGWKDFQEQEVLEDNTDVFTRSGIIKFSIPKDIASKHTQLTTGKYWLRVTIPENTLGVADAYQIASQAVTATFVNQNNASSHLSRALAAESIKKFKISDSKVKKIKQPHASFGGQLEETSETYYTRVSERLRHKNRAISIWDYERIILEAFPAVYKVKCLNHYNPEVSECKRQLNPGAVTLLILSKVEDENELSKRLAPITNVITLNDIKQHLAAISSPFISGRNKLFVQNPAYEYLKVNCSVKFKTGFDQGYYQVELNTDIQKYFSPWAFDESRPISFERKVFKSLIINYIEELEYVDFVCCFELYQATDEDGPFKEIKEDTYEVSDPATILISVHQHDIGLVTGDVCDCRKTQQQDNNTVATGIGAMIVEYDFEVYDPKDSES